MELKKTTFALFFGTRGFFPSSLIAQARQDIPRVLKEMGYEVLMLEEEATRFGAVETRQEGEVFARFLQDHRGKFEGVILCLPNFGDEFGAVIALKDADVPIFVQAYPDELDKMAPDLRRDAYCGKISVMDVFRQFGVNFTAIKPHVVDPLSEQFKENILYFDRVCKVVRGMRNMVVGAIGARTTPFKTVRIDEITLQRHGVTVEALDMSDIFAQVKALGNDDAEFKDKLQFLKEYAAWGGVPDGAIGNLAKLSVVLDHTIEEYKMDAIAIRCWLELQKTLGISPCVLLGALNDGMLPAACEVDIGSAVSMHALSLASGEPPACLDWNNNYADQEDKCILFHCGPIPNKLMVQKGLVTGHAILDVSLGEGCSYGPNQGRIRPMDFTFSNLVTDEGLLVAYLGEGRFTQDPVPDNYFGCAGVAHIDCLEDVLLYIGQNGHRHHVSITPGKVVEPVYEALTKYLDYVVDLPQQG